MKVHCWSNADIMLELISSGAIKKEAIVRAEALADVGLLNYIYNTDRAMAMPAASDGSGRYVSELRRGQSPMCTCQGFRSNTGKGILCYHLTALLIMLHRGGVQLYPFRG